MSRGEESQLWVGEASHFKSAPGPGVATRPLSMEERALTSTEMWRKQLNLKFLLSIWWFVIIQSWHDKYTPETSFEVVVLSRQDIDVVLQCKSRECCQNCNHS